MVIKQVFIPVAPPPLSYKFQKIIKRAEWGAIPPLREDARTYPHAVLQVGFFETYDQPCKNKEECIRTLRRTQRHHMEDLGMPDIACNFYLCAENLVFEGRGWQARSDKVNLHHVHWDHKSIDIGYVGTFNEETTTLEGLTTRDGLISDGIVLRYISRLASIFN